MENIIAIREARFEDEKRIAIFIPKQDDLIQKIKKIPQRRWSVTHQCWHFPYNLDYWGMFKSLFQSEAFNILDAEKPIIIPFYEMIDIPKLELTKVRFQKDEPPTDLSPSVPENTSETFAQQFDNQQFIKTIKKEHPDKIIVTKANFWQGKLRIDMPYRPDWADFMKNLSGKYWHTDKKCWSLPHSPLILEKLKCQFGDLLYIDITSQPNTTRQENKQHIVKKAISDTPPQYYTEVLRLTEKMTLKRMSISTIKTYKNGFAQFLQYYNDIHPKDITKQQIIDYMLHRIQHDKISVSIQNNFINAIKCYYEFVLGQDRTAYDLQRPKRPFQLPNIFSEEEIIKLFKPVTNTKHRCILAVIYGSGMRLSEVINLRIADIHRAENCIFIKGGKGKKDRYTLLSETFLEELDPYLAEYKPKYWLFEGQTGGQYAARSVQCILRDAVEKSGVNPFGTVHTLRHSFATHLVLGGYDILSVQKLMGHESPETTEIYVHLTGEQIRRVKSPLDKLKL